MLGLLALLGLFVLLLAWRGQLGNFFSLANIQVLLHKNSIPAVAALGMLLIIVSGGIDLSVGSVVALVTVVTMQTVSPGLQRAGTNAAVRAGRVAAREGVGVEGNRLRILGQRGGAAGGNPRWRLVWAV